MNTTAAASPRPIVPSDVLVDKSLVRVALAHVIAADPAGSGGCKGKEGHFRKVPEHAETAASDQVRGTSNPRRPGGRQCNGAWQLRDSCALRRPRRIQLRTVLNTFPKSRRYKSYQTYPTYPSTSVEVSPWSPAKTRSRWAGINPQNSRRSF